MSRYK